MLVWHTKLDMGCVLLKISVVLDFFFHLFFLILHFKVKD